uniref:Uncharacterized protein n=1 Tax=Timema genevievae TaxID=629358 RepID=A0A7R9JPU4_TIMGE|nr:unnamed protein product [Timema genevievae]
MALLKHLKNTTDRGVLRIAGYFSWVGYNLRWPGYETARLYRRCPALANHLLSHPRWIKYRWKTRHGTPTTIFSDVTPWSLAAYNPKIPASMVKRLYHPSEINQAEIAAGLLALYWEKQERSPSLIRLITDSSSTFYGIKTGKGLLRPPPPLATYGCPSRDLLPSLPPMARVYKRQWMRSRDSVIRWRGKRQQMTEIKMPSGNVDKPVIEDNRDGTVSIKYDPKEEGLHELAVKYNGEHVQG